MKIESFVLEACCRAAHEANRAFSIALGDTTHKTWDESPEWHKASTRLGVMGVVESDHNPEQSHHAWVQNMLANGWQVGPTKDVDKKIHPGLVPFKDLPFEIQHKDEMFMTIVKVMVAGILRIPQ